MASSSAGKLVVVTGCTKGLGEALVASLVGAGHTVAGCGRSVDAIDALRKKYAGRKCMFTVVNIGSDSEVSAWAADVIAKLGTPNLVLNNAAVMLPPKAIWETNAADVDNLLHINISGSINVLRHFTPALIASGKPGVIVNFSSYWGRSASDGVGAYCASKWGIEGLSASLAQDLRKHTRGRVSAVCVNPGIICTDMLATAFGPTGARQYPSPQQWAAAATPFLLGLGSQDNGKSVTVPGF